MSKHGSFESTLTPRGRVMVRLFAKQEKNGMSFRAFALARGIRPGTFSWWKREIRLARARWETRSRDVEGLPHFLPLEVIDDRPRPSVSTDASFTIIVRGERRVVVPHGFVADDLARIVKVLESC